MPVLTFNGFALVKTRGFEHPRMLGNPVQAARVYDSRGVDELVFLDIFATRQGRKLDLRLVRGVLCECFMPTAVGGGIDSLEEISNLLSIGADKVILGAVALQRPEFVSLASRQFGAQAICVALDAARNERGEYHLKAARELEAGEFAARMQDLGAGELLVTSTDQDGMMTGFAVSLLARVRALTNLPLIACGGAGEPQHFVDLFQQCPVEAIAAASIFHFTQYTPEDVKNALAQTGAPVRLLSARS